MLLPIFSDIDSFEQNRTHLGYYLPIVREDSRKKKAQQHQIYVIKILYLIRFHYLEWYS